MRLLRDAAARRWVGLGSCPLRVDQAASFVTLMRLGRCLIIALVSSCTFETGDVVDEPPAEGLSLIVTVDCGGSEEAGFTAETVIPRAIERDVSAYYIGPEDTVTTWRLQVAVTVNGEDLVPEAACDRGDGSVEFWALPTPR